MKLTYTRAEIRKLVDKPAYDDAIQVYMAETGKFPPTFVSR